MTQPEPAGGPTEPAFSADARLADLTTVLRAVSRIESVAALERVICALAVHPEGGGFQAATLLRRVPGIELLELGCREVARGWCPPLLESLEALSAARLAEPEGAGIGFASGDLDGAAGEAWAGGSPVIGADGAAATPWRGAGPVGALALRWEGEPWALLVVERAGGVGEVDRPRLEALMALAAEAQSALARRDEARRRSRQMAALAELSRACLSTVHLTELVRLGTRLAMIGAGARGAAIWLLGASGRARLEAVEGPPGWRERVARGAGPLVREVIESGQARCADPALAEPALAADVAAEVGAIVLVPLLAYGHVLGVVAVFLAGGAPGSARDPLGFLAALGDLVALAADQARRGEGSAQLERRTRELAARLRREERRALAGELALRAGAEARNPLASIAAFARRLERELGADVAHHDYLEVIVREAERLERLLAEPVDAAPPDPPTLRLERLNDVVQGALQRIGEALVRRRVRLLKRLAPDLPPLLLDPVRVGRVVDNVLGHVLEVLPAGGRVRVESRRSAGYAVLEIAHDGPHAPGEALDNLFVPFAAGRPGGPEIGLAVARRVVQEHGGEIRVHSEGEWSTVLAISFPLRDNQDRRKAGESRRTGPVDRRLSTTR